MREPLPFDGASWPRVALLAAGIFAVCFAWAYAVAQPPQETTRSTTPEAWTPQTIAPAVETEVQP